MQWVVWQNELVIEAAIGGVLLKKGVEIFKNSQETPVPESLFLIKLQVWGLQLY